MTQQIKDKVLIINTDGGSRGNPGPAGIGFVISDHDKQLLLEQGKFIGVATNNVAEYKALIAALQSAIKLGGTSLQILMDSELIVKQMKGEYRVKDPNLKELFLEVQTLLKEFDDYSFTHVLREFNKAADAQVNKAIDAAM
ncbi:MAG: ribonuclease HI family protein [Candidatus Doudnabacteria bacterium]